jgi:serine/threonine-protein kinase
LSRLTTALGGRYRIERELGAGAMATVYLAEDVKHRRRVAVKVLRPELGAAIGHERFLREIEISAGLSHPHILPLYDSGEADGLLYYVMPYVEGESLRDRLDREKQLPLDDALHISREVADALSYAHSRGVVHRDIKPENILLQSGHAVVADFGIARAVSAAGGDRLTQTGVAVGTPAYMSPEQAAGDRELDGRSDLYALGCVLYEMLTGDPPFSGPTVESVVRQHLLSEPRPVASLRPAVPAEVAAALQRALAKNPADRFNPVAQFSEALTAAPWASKVDRRPRSGRLLVLGLGLVGAVAMATLFLLRPRRDEPLPAIARTIQVTRDPGLELDPALSPDGEMVAYAAGPADAMQILVRRVAGGGTVALTDDASRNQRAPRWSPDGTQIAYQTEDGIYVVPSLGGPPRLVVRAPELTATVSSGSFTPLAGLTWSPDGGRIAFAGSYGAEGLYVVGLEGGEPVRLAATREPHSPAWSPDGTKIAVASGNAVFRFGIAYLGNAGTSSIWVVPAEGGDPVRVTEDAYLDTSPVWSPSGRYLNWVSDQGGARDVYRVRVDRTGAPVESPVRLTTGLDAFSIDLAADGSGLAYSSLRTVSNIWSIPVPADGPISIARAQPVTRGNQTIEDVDVSIDGEWLVFDSDRNGNADLYKLRVGGSSEPVQLTIDPAGDYSAVWSPNGRRVGFHSLRAGNRDLFTVEADGTGLVQRTSSLSHELDPDWSADGEALVAEVIDPDGIRENNFIIVPLEGGESTARRLPAVGDFAVWSPDGGLIAYHASDGLRVIAPEGGESRLIVSNVEDDSEAFYCAWSPDGGTLYYLTRGTEGWTIRAVPRDGGASRVLVRFDDPARQHTRYGFATDGRTFYFTMGSHESDVWVLELETP